MSIKNKILLFITFILSIFSFALLTIIEVQQEEDMKILQTEYLKNTKNLYEKINKKYENFYSDKILFNSNFFYVKEAIKSRDKQLLYKLSSDTFIRLQKENPNLVIMNFHLPDNTLLLKMNQPHETYMYKNRSLLEKVHKSKEAAAGFYKDEDYLAYRIMQPIFYSEEYIGVLELGINIDYVLKDMKHYSNIEGVMFIENKLTYKTIENIEILDNIFEFSDIIKTRSSVYLSYFFSIKNSENISVANIHFFKNITKEANKFKKDEQIISTLLAGMVFLTLLVVSFGLKRSLKNLQDSYDDFSEHKDMVDDNIIIVETSSDGTIVGVSNRFCEISGYKEKELISKPFEMIMDSEIAEQTNKSIKESLQKDGEWSGDLKNRTKDGKIYWLSSKTESKIKDKKLICFNHIMHDVTYKKINEDLLLGDELTNMYNRRYFNDLFPRTAKGIKRNGGCFNLIVLDIDDFKNYNDIYGHDNGDKAIVDISNVIIKSFRRPDDFCFRLGGAEFGIIFKSANEDEGYLYTQVLRKNIEMIRIKHEGNVIYKVLTASFGLVSVMSDNIGDEKEIYKLAYEHLYRAKEDGRNKVIRKLA
ncbi:diguanylate cyclase [Candidatus Sulfurimonas marisnigri]|uniref:diguanylate cyclase n=1 Tax=Candidatus Sulfurimonas marisnigri TaxID=2740405 RepID=A0A7S7RQX6_9BACT|nr:diguanylate cyclase [Candidatus Sulfurimonas marisnigri]QOY55033.1 diguanylate cyclase [Candidatus Sulfurimonas marisnigri]